MDAEEKLTALKKAYADIILNISKEAAARVMVTERKAARYQHELKVAKEEGLRMLVRLKGMMDSEVTKAQAASLNKQNKIEVLEAQLQEAEDIVEDLREELREAQSELERAKSENIPPNVELQNIGPREIAAAENEFYSYESSTILPPKSDQELAVAASHITMPHPSERYEYHKCNNIGNHRDLPSIILRGKECGLYRNGCTQRIHACDSLPKEFTRETDNLKDKIKKTELNEGKNICRAPSKSPIGLQKKLLTGVKTIGSIIQKRKRTTRRRKVITRFFGKKPPHLPVTDLVKGKTLFCDNLLKEEQNIQMDCAKLSEKETNVVEIDIAKNVLTNVELIEEMAPMRDETTGCVENLKSPVCKVDVEDVNDDVPLSNLEMKNSVTEGFTTQSIRDRVIKYTFQRKRKRQALGDSNGNAVTLGTEKKKGDKLSGDKKQEPPKVSFVAESSRENRRLAQVARQLISLSRGNGSKVWQ